MRTRVVYLDYPCQCQSPSLDRRHNSFSAVCPEEESSGTTNNQSLDYLLQAVKPRGLSFNSPRTHRSTPPAFCSLSEGNPPSACWFCLAAPCELGSPSSQPLSEVPTQSLHHLQVKNCHFIASKQTQLNMLRLLLKSLLISFMPDRHKIFLKFNN